MQTLIGMVIIFKSLMIREKRPNTAKPVLSGPHIKRTPSIKWTPASVPKFPSHIYCKINLHSADTSVKRMRTPILRHFVAQNLQ